MTLRKWSFLLAVSYVGLVAVASSANKPAPHFVIQEENLPVPTRLYFGVVACSNGGCHDNPTNPNQQDIILCGYDEVQIWTKFDKHKDANKVLKGERARQMAKLLGIAGDIATEAACVSCHGVLVENDKFKHSSFRLEDGVSCVACHGAYKEWVARHADFLERDEWRKLSRKVKEERYGMRDLWDPEKRATLCASCHIGNPGERKVVTHEMYAAGHPPLPGIEMAAFSDAMPRHWKYLAEKSPKVQAILEYDPAKGDLERTQLTVIGGLVSLRESMNLLATQAEENGGKKWPELAQLDCYACHHDLKSPSWRQQRGNAGKPGRPDLRPWPLALAQLGVVHAAGGDAEKEKKLRREMHDKMKRLSAAFAAQPFGDAKEVALAAKQMSAWVTEMLKNQKATFDRPAASRLVASLGKESKARLLDFDSARQLAWAFRSIQGELDPRFATDPEAATLLKDLDEQLKLDLPKGQKEIAGEFLKETLEKLNTYEPARFERTFEQLLKKRPPQ